MKREYFAMKYALKSLFHDLWDVFKIIAIAVILFCTCATIAWKLGFELVGCAAAGLLVPTFGTILYAYIKEKYAIGKLLYKGENKE